MRESEAAASRAAARPKTRMLGPCAHESDDTARLGELLLKQRISELHAASASLLTQVDTLAKVAQGIASRLRAGAKVMLAGNGGSACQAQHFAAELLGRLSPVRDRSGLAACVLGSDLPTMTAIANDYGYENVFCRQLQGIARPGDALILFSTSGQSENLLRAAVFARSLEVFTVALVGSDGSALSDCDAVVTVRAKDPGTIQECHLLMIHTLVHLIEDEYGCWLPQGVSGQLYAEPVGAENSATSCDLGVFVEEAAEPVASDDLKVGVDRVGERSQRTGLVQVGGGGAR